jgi:uncharacterized membrane protein YphA (DoxX/SURF4 family)
MIEPHDYVLTIARCMVGMFFAISGYHKLFNPERHRALVSTLRTDHLPLIRVVEWQVPATEFLGGLCLIMGLLTPLAALGLFTICIVATLVDGLGRIPAMKPIDLMDWIACLLYLPEVWLAILLATFMAYWGGPISLDAVLFY